MSATNDLRHKATSGVVWSAVQKVAVTAITFVSDSILARLLTPYDFGCIEMLVIFMLLAETIIHGGFGSALIQKKRPTQEDYSTVFFWNLGMSVLMYATLYWCAPFISRFYRIPILISVLRVQGLVLFLYALNVVQYSILTKQFRFKAIAIVTIAANVTSFGVTLVMAYMGYGVWALVAKNLIATGLTTVIFWFYFKWRPRWTFSRKSFKELFGFGFYMFLSNLVTSFSAKLQSMLIGRVYNPTTMGYYSKASGTTGVASSTISQILDRVTFPLYAEAQDDLSRLGNIVKRLVLALAYVTFPLMFVMILVAKPMFVFLYSEKWLPSVPYFQILCIGGLATCLQSVNFYTISAIGKSKVTFLWTMIKRGVGMLMIVGGMALFGMKGILAGAICNEWFTYFVNMGLVSKYVGYKWYRQLIDLLPIVVNAIVCFVLSYVVVNMFEFDLYIDGGVKFLIYVILYIGFSVIVKQDAFIQFKDVMLPLLSKINFLNRIK